MQSAGTDLELGWRHTSLQEQIWIQDGAMQSAGTDLDSGWRYAKFSPRRVKNGILRIFPYDEW